MRKIFSLFTILAFTIAVITPTFMTSCDPDDPDDSTLENALGWFGLGGDNGDNLDDIENDISFGGGNLPSSVDLSGKFPPIGNQGQYGTCVAWATGYNHRSYLQAVNKGYTTSDMTNSSKTFSPKYLFTNIPNSQKGDDCNGTGFEPAYEVMLNTGIATMSEVPYTNLGDCSSPASSTSAGSYKVQSYREISKDVTTLKEYLADGRAIAFGAKLGDNFMSWNSSGVLDGDTYGYTGQHAYHAMILCGYDDNVGNGAFRVVNSWGTGWGDNGYIWVDQAFFSSDNFCFCAFVSNGATDPDGDDPNDDDNQVDDPTTGKDLMGWELNDEDNGGGTSRVAKYNAFNSGTEEITASMDWNIIYLAYEANNANNYTILLYDYYSDDFGNYGDDGELTTGGYGVENWYNHINIPSGQSVAMALYGGPEARFSWPYTMPDNLNGEYYLVLIADGFDVIQEADEENNYFFLTDANGGPITIVNGVISEALANNSKSKSTPGLFEKSAMQSARTQGHMNTYTPQEIRALIKDRRKSGDIARRAAEFTKRNTGTKKVESN